MNPNRTVPIRNRQTTQRLRALVAAAVCLAVQAGVIAIASGDAEKPTAGTELTNRVTFPAPIVLGTRG